MGSFGRALSQGSHVRVLGLGFDGLGAVAITDLGKSGKAQSLGRVFQRPVTSISRKAIAPNDRTLSGPRDWLFLQVFGCRSCGFCPLGLDLSSQAHSVES